jgi:hypothetical protein
MKIINSNVPYYNRQAASGETKRLSNKPIFSNTVSNTQNSKTKYFSSIDADIYFGDTFIDEVTFIQWELDQQTMPLMGYNSYVFDDIAVGSRMIQGRVGINFTNAGYLYTVLDTLTKIVQSDAQALNASTKTSSEDPLYDNQHKPLWNKMFDIYVRYGGDNQDNPAVTYYILRGVQLTGVSQQLTSDGQPVGEFYTFIAQDLVPQSNMASTLDQSGSNTLVTPISFFSLLEKFTVIFLRGDD